MDSSSLLTHIVARKSPIPRMTDTLAKMAESNKSVEDAIFQEAKKRGIKREGIMKYFDFVLEDQLKSDGISTPQRRLARVGYLVWEHFFPGSPCPGAEQKEKSEDALRAAREADKIGRGESLGKSSSWAAGNMDDGWLHDKYDPMPSHSRQLETKPARNIDSYVPRYNVRSPERLSSHRNESNRPSGRALALIANTYRPTERVSTSAQDARGVSDRTENKYRRDRSRSRSREYSRVYRDRSPNSDRKRRRHRNKHSRSRSGSPVRSHSPPRAPSDNYRYKSQLKELKEMLLAAGKNLSYIITEYDQKKRAAEKRYPDQGSSWQQWYTESVLWQLHSGTRFPGKEPAMKHNLTIRKGEDGEYATLECYMEAKAVAGNKRGAFFNYLQRMRDTAKDEHRGCSQTTRAYVADFLTWKRFWPDEIFPAPPANGHSLNCRLKTKTANLKELNARATATAPTDAQQSSFPAIQPTPPIGLANHTQLPFGAIQFGAMHPVSMTRGFPFGHPAEMDGNSQYSPYMAIQPAPHPFTTFSRSTLAGDLAAIKPLEQPSISLEAAPPASVVKLLLELQKYQGAGKIIIVNERQIPCQRVTLVAMTYNAIKAEIPMVFMGISSNLRCFMHFHRVASGDLLLWAYPRYTRDEPAAKVGQAFFCKWVEKNLSGSHVKPSEYWREFETTSHYMEFRWGKVVPSGPTLAFHPHKSSLAVTKSVADNKQIESKASSSKNQNEADGVGKSLGEQETLKAVVTPTASLQEKVHTPSENAPNFTISKPSSKINKALGWGEYQEKFKPSDTDIIRMEEQAKAEGLLRMVLDEETGEVVSLKVMLSRNARRSTGRDGGRQGRGGASATMDRELGKPMIASQTDQSFLQSHPDSLNRTATRLGCDESTHPESPALGGSADRKRKHDGESDLTSSQASRMSSGPLRKYRKINGRAIEIKYEGEEEEGEVVE